MSAKEAREKFAMIPESVITGIPGNDTSSRAVCLMLYTYLDLRQGAQGRPERGFRKVSKKLGLQPDTVASAAARLAAAGLIRLQKEGCSSAVMEVIHNPARGRSNAEAVIREAPTRSGHAPVPNPFNRTGLSRSTGQSESTSIPFDGTGSRSPRSDSSALLELLTHPALRCADCLGLTSVAASGPLSPEESFCGCPF